MERDIREEHERVLKTTKGYSPDIRSAAICGHCAKSLYFKGNIGFIDADGAEDLKLRDNSFPLFNGENFTKASIEILSKVRFAKHVHENMHEIVCNHCGSTYNNCIIQRVLNINVLVFI